MTVNIKTKLLVSSSKSPKKGGQTMLQLLEIGMSWRVWNSFNGLWKLQRTREGGDERSKTFKAIDTALPQAQLQESQALTGEHSSPGDSMRERPFVAAG